LIPDNVEKAGPVGPPSEVAVVPFAVKPAPLGFFFFDTTPPTTPPITPRTTKTSTAMMICPFLVRQKGTALVLE
jgi:hypothetical protein